jgi:O-acetyl-ADP-ribose deacetylase (regulator of RNase III)
MEVFEGAIPKLPVDAIVNAANTSLIQLDEGARVVRLRML